MKKKNCQHRENSVLVAAITNNNEFCSSVSTIVLKGVFFSFSLL